MSEYQYYEFQAIDRPLTSREMGELRAVSSRAAITATRFTNHLGARDREPPVPAGLSQLTAPLRAFVDFFRIDEDLVAIAAERSVNSTLAQKDVRRLVGALPDAEKAAFLVRVAEGEGALVQAELLRRSRPERTSSASQAPSAAPKYGITRKPSANRPRGTRSRRSSQPRSPRTTTRPFGCSSACGTSA